MRELEESGERGFLALRVAAENVDERLFADLTAGCARMTSYVGFDVHQSGQLAEQ
jgi:Holliday junction resolvase